MKIRQGALQGLDKKLAAQSPSPQLHIRVVHLPGTKFPSFFFAVLDSRFYAQMCDRDMTRHRKKAETRNIWLIQSASIEKVRRGTVVIQIATRFIISLSCSVDPVFTHSLLSE